MQRCGYGAVSAKGADRPLTMRDLRLASVDGFRAGMVVAELAFAGAAVGVFGISNWEAVSPSRRSATRRRRQPEAEPGGALAHPRDRLGAELPEAGEDGEPVALGVVHALLGEARAPGRTRISRLRSAPALLHQRVLEGAERVGHGHAVRRARRSTSQILAEREFEERDQLERLCRPRRSGANWRRCARSPRRSERALGDDELDAQKNPASNPSAGMTRAATSASSAGAPAAGRSGTRSARS